MKSVGVIVFAVVAFTSLTGIICNPVHTEIEPNCDLYKAIPGIGLACNRMMKPVCGTDGRTYSNECDLCSNKLKESKEIKIKYKKSCIVEDECEQYGDMCTFIYQPVCGSDDVTYPSKCSFCNVKKRNADLLLVSEGECKPKDECEQYGNVCSLIYKPVCGSDDVTYPSKCNFCNAKRRIADLIVVSEGECSKQI